MRKNGRNLALKSQHISHIFLIIANVREPTSETIRNLLYAVAIESNSIQASGGGVLSKATVSALFERSSEWLRWADSGIWIAETSPKGTDNLAPRAVSNSRPLSSLSESVDAEQWQSQVVQHHIFPRIELSFSWMPFACCALPITNDLSRTVYIVRQLIASTKTSCIYVLFC